MKSIHYDFIAIIETSNSWVVYDTEENYFLNENHMKELKSLVRKCGGEKSDSIFIEFSKTFDADKLLIQRKELIKNIEKFKITKNIYNLQYKEISEIICNFINKSCQFGIINITPIKNNLIPIDFIKQMAPSLRHNKAIENKKIYEKYIPYINTARKLYSDKKVLDNIKIITDRIYLDKEHKLVHSLFDSHGKKIRAIFEKRYEWYSLPEYVGSSLMIASGAFGYHDHKAILFLAFQRLHEDLSIIEGRRDWRVIDNMIPSLLRNKLSLLNYFSWMTKKGYFKNDFILDTIPFAEIIPGGLFCFEIDFSEETRNQLEIFYPNIKYKLIDHQNIMQQHEDPRSTQDFINSMPGLR